MKSRESKEKDALGFLVFALFVYTLFTPFYSTIFNVLLFVFESITCSRLTIRETKRIIQWPPMVPETLLNNGNAKILESMIAVL